MFPVTLLTQSQFAKRKDVSRAAVTQWKSAGRLVLVGNLIDLEATEAKLLAHSSSRTKRGIPAANGVNQPPRPAVKSKTLDTARTQPAAAPLDDHVATVVALIDGGAEDIAILLLARGMPRGEVRQIVNAWLAGARRGASALLEEDVDLPTGFDRWADHPSFLTPFAPDWAELDVEAASIR
jgi:hypothetical protein